MNKTIILLAFLAVITLSLQSCSTEVNLNDDKFKSEDIDKKDVIAPIDRNKKRKDK